LLLIVSTYYSIPMPTGYAHFENAIGRLSVNPFDHHIAIEYHQGPRHAVELQAFLTQAGNLLVRWGWEKLLNTQVAMADFTPEELEEVCAYWRSKVAQHPAILHGALLLPHKVFARLSWQAT
jgi:hypothetical protein